MKLAVIEDEDGMRQLLQEFLHAKGYGVDTYGTATEALSAFNPLQTGGVCPVDMLVSDVRLGAFHGFDLLKILKLWYPALPVVLISAFWQEWEKKQASSLGSSAQLSKPFSLAELGDTIQSALATE